ncbi:unnamed protein product, partial [Nesidiocoris tenuis]
TSIPKIRPLVLAVVRPGAFMASPQLQPPVHLSIRRASIAQVTPAKVTGQTKSCCRRQKENHLKNVPLFFNRDLRPVLRINRATKVKNSNNKVSKRSTNATSTSMSSIHRCFLADFPPTSMETTAKHRYIGSHLERISESVLSDLRSDITFFMVGGSV